MGDVVNLRRFRKSRERAGRAEDAARSRAAFGRTREERDASAGEARRAEARLDAHRREAAADRRARRCPPVTPVPRDAQFAGRPSASAR